MKTWKRLLAVLLCMAGTLPAAGCRYSPTIQEIIYRQYRNGDFDVTPPFTLKEDTPEAEDESEELPELEEEPEAERLGDEVPEQPIDEPPEEPAPTPPPEEPEQHSAEAVYLEEGAFELPADAPTAQQTPGDRDTEPPEEAEEAATDPEAVDESGGGEGGAGTEGTGYEPDAYARTGKLVVDAYGREVTIPENVDTVAAVGELAVMVLMLSGPERLAAANGELISDALALRAFDGLAGVPALWSGDGNHRLGDGEFETLCGLRPDVVLEFSGSAAFSDAQIQRLQSEGTAYLALPQPAGRQAVATILETLGTVLGDRSGEGGANAPQIAEDYIAWQDGIYRAVDAATGGFAAKDADEDGENGVAATYTLFVDGWDDDARYRLYNDTYTTLSGSGCAYISNAATAVCRSVTASLACANVVNTASLYGIAPKVQYFTPLISDYRAMDVSGRKADGMVTAGQKLLEQGGESLGTAGFRHLIAADRHTAEAIGESELWSVYPHINSGDGSFNGDGFLDEEGNLVRTQISGEYEILVNPTGLSSWTRGGTESVLECAWAAWRFFDAVSEGQVRDWVRQLYGGFYGLELTDGELDAILEGR